MAYPTISQTDFVGLPLLARGKVRDIYDLGDRLLIVATDRLSAFDVILPTPIPDKGRVLTQLSLFWFGKLAGVVPHHVITATDFSGELAPYRDALNGRAMVVRRTDPIPIECVARGYISGSGWKDYCATGKICGIPLPAGLKESDRLPEPIFTPATKATSGHDENISFEEAAERIGRPLAERLRGITLEIYRRASEYAAARGIIIADTKLEFGLDGGELVWIDEALTPDSSRFWPADSYQPGKAQPSFDKQFVRDYLERIGWSKQPPAPALPPDVVNGTRAKYREAYERLTGHPLD
ncbi:MAG TPA: phosphoribosylaminoimidazolesuccinocarboxamide synthase [Candidatus Limnocylindrales bacterium]|nr:phosphoribosylaminoimidazolesuccinocarboxamide synthase [Candidatus Limnocylindrales bacterium]